MKNNIGQLSVIALHSNYINESPDIIANKNYLYPQTDYSFLASAFACKAASLHKRHACIYHAQLRELCREYQLDEDECINMLVSYLSLARKTVSMTKSGKTFAIYRSGVAPKKYSQNELDVELTRIALSCYRSKVECIHEAYEHLSFLIVHLLHERMLTFDYSNSFFANINETAVKSYIGNDGLKLVLRAIIDFNSAPDERRRLD